MSAVDKQPLTTESATDSDTEEEDILIGPKTVARQLIANQSRVQSLKKENEESGEHVAKPSSTLNKPSVRPADSVKVDLENSNYKAVKTDEDWDTDDTDDLENFDKFNFNDVVNSTPAEDSAGKLENIPFKDRTDFSVSGVCTSPGVVSTKGEGQINCDAAERDTSCEPSEPPNEEVRSDFS